MAHVIAVLNSKGGSGKTTLAMNIAGCLQRRSRSVLVIDSDPQASALDWAAAQPEGFELPPVIGIDRPTIHTTIPKLQNDYDFIVIDGGAKLAEITASALRVADLVLIPVRHSGLDVWAVEALVEAIHARKALTDKPAAAFVVSAQVRGTKLAEGMDESLADMGIPLLKARTTRRVAYESAAGMGVTVMDLAGQDKAAEEIEAITTELLTHLNDQETQT